MLAWTDAIPVVLISVSIVYCAFRFLYKLCIAKPRIPTDEDHQMAVSSVVCDPNLKSLANRDCNRKRGLVRLLAQVSPNHGLPLPSSMLQISVTQYQRRDHVRIESLSQALPSSALCLDGPAQTGVSVFFCCFSHSTSLPPDDPTTSS